MGKTITIQSLLDKHDAVIIAAGTFKTSIPNLPRSNLLGIKHGLDFLFEVHTDSVEIGKNVIIIGGGYAMDCARTVRRLDEILLRFMMIICTTVIKKKIFE